MAELQGRTILVGLTRLLGGDDYEQEQFAGTASISDAEGYCLVTLHCTDGEVRDYPFDARSLQRAQAGEYRLRSTGEIIKDPDFLMTWTIAKD